MIKAIIFDFAGVIGSDGYWVILKERLPDIQKRKQFFHNLSIQVDDGSISNKQFASIISKELTVPENEIETEIFKRIIINKELLERIRQLRKQYKICLLTNYTHEWMERLFQIYSLDQFFDVKVISSLVGLVKPDKKIYQLALNRLEIKPEEAVFIDDRQYNVDGGEQAGIKSLLFTNNELLEKDFLKLGIKF